MALMLDVRAGVLSGGRFGGMLGTEPGEGGMAQFFLTIDVTRFMPLDQFKARMDELIDQIHNSEKAPGVNKIYVAGEIEYGLQSGRERDGVPIEESVLADLDRLEQALG
jgi:LDH2 family malate/lactate/ureidoglycolate dehydrogenase